MRLSQIDVERGMDVLSEILIPIANIALDKNMAPLLKKVQVTEEDSQEEMIRKVIKHWESYVPELIKSHKDDMIQIFASLNNSSIEEYKKKNILQLAVDIRDFMTDPDLHALFRSAQIDDKKE